MTIDERALELVPPDAILGLGSGRAAQAFVRALGERVRSGSLRARGVPTSDETAKIAHEVGIPLLTLAEAGVIDLTVDGADEVDPNLDMIKGYGRALVREKIVAASSKRLIILVGQEKLVSQLGARGKLPVEIVPFALPLCERRLKELGLAPVLWNGTTDNGNLILDCALAPIQDTAQLQREIQSIPGVVNTGLFLKMANIVLVGDSKHFALVEEKKSNRER